MTTKLRLERRHESNDPRYLYINWRSCLPFMENSRATLIHRPRAVATVAKSAIQKRPYLIATMHCGTSMVNSEHWTFLSEPPAGKIVCARCEALAVHSGLPTSDELCGRHVHIGGVKAFITCCQPKEIS